jgi:hypothetical protein
MYIFTPLDRNGKIRKPVLDIVRLRFPEVSADTPLEDLRNTTQKLVLKTTPSGTPGLRRQSVAQVNFDGEDSKRMLELFRRVGLVDEVTTLDAFALSEVKHILVPGGDPRPQRLRTGLVAKLWSMGVRPDSLVYMDGGRDPKLSDEAYNWLVAELDTAPPIKPGWRAPSSLPTETAINEAVWGQAILPPGMDALNPNYVVRIPAAGKLTATPEQQLAAWIDQCDPEPGNLLLVTIQPHLFQLPMWRALLEPHGFQVECVAASALPGRHDIAYLADGLARAIHVYWKTTK